MMKRYSGPPRHNRDEYPMAGIIARIIPRHPGDASANSPFKSNNLHIPVNGLYGVAMGSSHGILQQQRKDNPTMNRRVGWYRRASLWSVLGALLLTGCATPRSRIQEFQTVFDSLDPAQQELIEAGQIDIGFTEDMVYMALGKPDREFTRRTAEGEVALWAYTSHFTRTRRELVHGTFRVHDRRAGRVHSVRDSVWVDVPTYHEFDRLRVEFDDEGVVRAIERAAQ